MQLNFLSAPEMSFCPDFITLVGYLSILNDPQSCQVALQLRRREELQLFFFGGTRTVGETTGDTGADLSSVQGSRCTATITCLIYFDTRFLQTHPHP